MKRKIFVVSLIAICLSLLGFGTMAYFTSEDTTHNVITSGGVNIDIQEWADKEKTVRFPDDGVTGVMPGTDITKIVEIKNTGSSDAYVRVKVEKDIVLPDETAGTPDLGLMKIDFDQTYWILGDDGYYYYKTALQPGTVTEPLFASVSFDISMGNMYENSTAKVDVTAYAVQTANNGTNAQEAKGWPEE